MERMSAWPIVRSGAKAVRAGRSLASFRMSCAYARRAAKFRRSACFVSSRHRGARRMPIRFGDVAHAFDRSVLFSCRASIRSNVARRIVRRPYFPLS
nr:hypothetical protein WG70_26195 [Burkholderia oklahomensis EO147]